MIDISTIPVRDFVEADTTRLISTAYLDEPALTPLADSDSDLAFLEDLEGQSSSRRGLPEFIPFGVHPRELVNEHHGYGWSMINAAFCHTRDTGNRFNGPERGAWYATWQNDRVETAKAEIAWHLTRELAATGIFDNLTAYRELNASFATALHDLNGHPEESIFDPDPAIGYPAGQRLAAGLRVNGANGVLYPSVRRKGGASLAAFRPAIIQNIRQGDTWRFEWSGRPEPTISRLV